MSPRIRNPRRLDLPPHGDVILGEMFPDYQEVVIKEELTAFGFSGGRVYQIHLVSVGDTLELPRVVKIAPPALIEKEVRAFHECVRNQWPGIAELYGAPVFLEEYGTAGLCYPMVGGGVFETQSLREYCLKAGIDDIRFVLEARLFRIMERRILGPARNVFEHPLRASYDRVLPVNLLVDPAPLPDDSALENSPLLITPDRLPAAPLQPGAWVRLEEFVVTDVNPHRPSATLNVPPDRPPFAFRMRLQPVEKMADYTVNQVMPSTEGVVRETRQSRLEEEVVKAMGAIFDPTSETVALPEGGVLPNPLRAVPEILSHSRHVRVNYIHGDLNLENILVDPQVRDVSLIDFTDSRRDHVLLDLLRLETEVLTKLIPVHLAEEELAPQIIVPFYEQLHCATFQLERDGVWGAPHTALNKPFAILQAIRKTARKGLYDRGDFGEYYQGLILYLLGALKFENLDDPPLAPLPKQVAFLGAATLRHLLATKPVGSASRQEGALVPPSYLPRDRVEPVVADRVDLVAPAGEPAIADKRPSPLRRIRAWHILAVLAIVVGLILVRWIIPRPQPLDSSPLCAIEEQLSIPIAMGGPNRQPDLLSYFRDANPELFAYLDLIAETYVNGEEHRGATYIIGPAGVGKSFVALAMDQFPEDDQCQIRLGELAAHGVEGIDFETQADLVTLDGKMVFNYLPTFSRPGEFSFDRLLAAGGCIKDDAPVPLIILDDLNELHNESTGLILEGVEEFISHQDGGAPFVHILVFGRSAGFAQWLGQERRVPPENLRVPRPLEGPLYTTSGDLEFAIRDYHVYKNRPPPPQEDIDRFVNLAVDYPFLTYSIRPLATRNFIMEAISNNIVTEKALKSVIFDNLMERNHQTHNRPGVNDPHYRCLLEDIAARYLEQVDEEGFFVVDFQEKIDVYDDERENVVGEVYVSDVLDRSGIAVLDPADVILSRYRFAPFWIHSHLIEGRNAHLNPGHEYRTCSQLIGQ